MIQRTALALLLIGPLGCDCNGKRAGEEAPAHAPSESSGARGDELPEPRGFSLALLEAASTGEAEAVDRLIDWRAVAERAARDDAAPEERLGELAESASKGSIEGGLAQTLASVAEGAAALRYLGVREMGGERWEMFRFTRRDGGFDHYGALVEGEGEDARAVDVFQLTQGETASEQLRRGLLRERGLGGEGLSEVDRDFIEHAEALREAEQMGAAGQGHSGLHRLDLLPDSLLGERSVMLLRVRLAEQASPTEHRSEVEALAEAFPDDPSVQIHLVDGFAVHGDADRALEALDRVAAGSQPDPFFDVIRANVLASGRRFAEAKAAAERAIAAEPSLEDAYWPALLSSLAEKNFEETTRYLLTLRREFGVDLEIEARPLYEEYVSSPEYPRYRELVSE